jgi:hypothetical protein
MVKWIYQITLTDPSQNPPCPITQVVDNREYLVVFGKIELVEAAGIEPASANPRPKASTCLDLSFALTH